MFKNRWKTNLLNIIIAVAVAMLPFCRPIPYPAPSMYSLRLNCSVGSSILSIIIGILAVAVVVLLVKVAVYRPAVKSNPAIAKHQTKKMVVNMLHMYKHKCNT